MTTVSQLATRSLKFLGAVIGGSEPALEDQHVAEQSLLELLVELPEYGAGREYREIETTKSVVAESDVRLVSTSPNLTIETPHNPLAGARFCVVPVNGNVIIKSDSRKIEGNLVPVSISVPAEWSYRADLGDWIKVSALTNASENPYPDWTDGPIVKMAASRIAPVLDIPITQERFAMINEARLRLSSHFSRPREARPSDNIPVGLMGGTIARRYK